MKPHYLAAALVAFASAAGAQTLKPGLWEVTNKMQSSSGQMEQSMAQMQQQMASMPPEQRKMVEEMMANKEINVVNRNETLHRGNIMGDFRFIVLEKFLSRDNELPLVERLIMKAYFLLKRVSLSEERAFGLDLSDVTIEKYPIIVSAVSDIQLKGWKTRIYSRSKPLICPGQSFGAGQVLLHRGSLFSTACS